MTLEEMKQIAREAVARGWDEHKPSFAQRIREGKEDDNFTVNAAHLAASAIHARLASRGEGEAVAWLIEAKDPDFGTWADTNPKNVDAWRNEAKSITPLYTSPSPPDHVTGLVEAPNGVVAEIAAERRRQVEVEGWTAEHDDQHRQSELARAASCYARDLGPAFRSRPPRAWPWHPEWWKPKGRRRDLIRAAALIVAEIERLDRARTDLSRAGRT